MKLSEKQKKLIFYSSSILIVLAVIFIVYQNLNAPTDVAKKGEEDNKNTEIDTNIEKKERELIGIEILTDPRFRSLVDTKILREYLNYTTKPGNKRPFYNEDKIKTSEDKEDVSNEKATDN